MHTFVKHVFEGGCVTSNKMRKCVDLLISLQLLTEVLYVTKMVTFLLAKGCSFMFVTFMKSSGVSLTGKKEVWHIA